MSRYRLGMLLGGLLTLSAAVLMITRGNDQRADEELRISARRLADGRVEVALQQRPVGPVGPVDSVASWEFHPLPNARFLPADAPAGVWRHSSLFRLLPRPTVARAASCPAAPRLLNVGFFASFPPVSYSADPDPASPGFALQRGYEADLLSAIAALDDANLRFQRIPIADWSDIWLTPTGPYLDLVGGGITILESRTRDASGEAVIAFTDGHINFRQSLLIRAADAGRIASHADLTAADVVGAVAATTGEARFLQLSGIADADGTLLAGTVIETPLGAVTADGTARFQISSAAHSPELEGRTRLTPPGERPVVVHLGDDDAAYLEALEAGQISGFARGEIGNTDAARASAGRFVVTALDPQMERGGFALPRAETALRDCLNELIGWLTDDGAIGYPEWSAQPTIFLERAQLWNAAR